MATKRIVQLPTVSGWIGTAGAGFNAHTITVTIPKGPRYHEIHISAHPGAGKFLLDTSGSNGLLKEIRLKINGKVQRIATAEEVNKINVLNGNNYACKNGLIIPASWTVAGEVPVLVIYLAEPWREDEDAQDGLAWATGGKDVETFEMEVDIIAYGAAAAGLTKPQCYAVIDSFVPPLGLGAIVKWRNVNIPVASGWNDFDRLPKKDFYQSIHIADANLTDFMLKVDNNIIREQTAAQNKAWLLAHAMLPNPAATATPYGAAADMPTRNMVDIVFDHDDKLSSSLPMVYGGQPVGDFNLRLNTTSTGTVKCIYQVIGPAD